jgi:MFS family permease
MTTVETGRPVPTLARNRGFGLLWFGEGVSVLGNATTSVLLPLVAVLEFDAGPTWMGLLAAATWLPWLIIGLPAGAWVDRLPARRVMIVSDLIAAAALLSVPVSWLLGVLSLPLLLGVALTAGATTVFFRTAYLVFVPQVVPGAQLESANARLIGTESAMQIAGPGAAGLIAQWFSAAGGLLLDAISFLVSAVCLWRIKPASATPRDRRRPTPLRTRIAEGVRFLAFDRYLRWLTVIGGISNFGLTGYTALIVLFLVRDLEVDPSILGVVMMLGSCGGLVGAMLATRLSRRFGSGRATVVLLVGSGPPALLVGAGGEDWLVLITVAGLFLVGAAVVAGNVLRGTWRQQYVPRPVLGRVVSASQIVNYGTMPLAGLVAGLLGSVIGVRETMLIMAAVHCIASMGILCSPFRSLRELPQPRTS